MAEILENNLKLQTLDSAEFTIVGLKEKKPTHQTYIVDCSGEEKLFVAMLNQTLENKAHMQQLASKNLLPTETNHPLAFCDDEEKNIFGFISNEAPNYTSLSSLIFERNAPYNPKQEIDVCLSIATAFGKLAQQGYFITSLTEDDFYFNITNGNIYMNAFQYITSPENDKISVSPRYLPPEYASGAHETATSVNSRFILAALIFSVMFRCHPFGGKQVITKPFLTNEDILNIYLTNPIFIFSETDTSNRPSEYIQQAVIKKWESLPEYIKELFQRSFSKASIENPEERPDEFEWLNALVKLRSFSFICSCSNLVTLSEEGKGECSNCQRKISLPCRLKLKDYTIPAIPKGRIYRCQVTSDYTSSTATEPVAVILTNPNNPQLLGYKNISSISLDCLTPAGVSKSLAPGEIAPLNDGIKVTAFETTILFINSTTTPAVPPAKTPIEEADSTVVVVEEEEADDVEKLLADLESITATENPVITDNSIEAGTSLEEASVTPSDLSQRGVNSNIKKEIEMPEADEIPFIAPMKQPLEEVEDFTDINNSISLTDNSYLSEEGKN